MREKKFEVNSHYKPEYGGYPRPYKSCARMEMP